MEIEQARSDAHQMQQNMDTIDENKEFSTEYEAPRGSYQNTERLRQSRWPNQPSIRYSYGRRIHTLVDYTRHSHKKWLKLLKEKGIEALHK